MMPCIQLTQLYLVNLDVYIRNITKKKKTEDHHRSLTERGK